jgi:polar amino acid transport system ATP-binding protein
MNPRLSVRGLSKRYGETPVLTDLDFVASPGETVAIIGRSGSGKTTLLRCLTLLDLPDRGDAYLDDQQYLASGVPLYEPWEIRRSIVLVFQDFNLFPNMTVLRNIALALEKSRGMSRREAQDRAEDSARLLGIGDVLDQYPFSLSGGQAQRCALARAMVLEPQVFLLDEITSALDPETVVNVVEAMRALRKADKSGRMAMIVVTHLMHFAEDFADRISFLHNGRIHEELPAKEFFRNCKEPETQKFIGAFVNRL